MSNLGVPLAVTLDPIFVGSAISAGRDAKVALIQFTDFPSLEEFGSDRVCVRWRTDKTLDFD
jgi:hypothetical protein